MKIVREVERIVVEQEVDDIVCNRCGKSCMDRAGMNFDGLLEASIQGGYASLLGYCATYTFSLCERCLGAMFHAFVIPPSVSTGLQWCVEMMSLVLCQLDNGNMSVGQLREALVASNLMEEEAFIAAMATLEECGCIGPVAAEADA